MRKRRAFVATALMAVGVAVIPALPAAAGPGPFSGTKSCSATVPKVQVQSTSTGKTNHALGSLVLGYWDNGTTRTTRWSPTNYSAGSWKVFLTGSGGDISYANAVCTS